MEFDAKDRGVKVSPATPRSLSPTLLSAAFAMNILLIVQVTDKFHFLIDGNLSLDAERCTGFVDRSTYTYENRKGIGEEGTQSHQ